MWKVLTPFFVNALFNGFIISNSTCVGLGTGIQYTYAVTYLSHNLSRMPFWIFISIKPFSFPTIPQFTAHIYHTLIYYVYVHPAVAR